MTEHPTTDGRLSFEGMVEAYGIACRQSALSDIKRREVEAVLRVMTDERDALLLALEARAERCPACGAER